MKRLLLLLMGCMVSAMTWAVKADPPPPLIKQADGTELWVMTYGDEDMHWSVTSDNVLLAHVGHNYYIAQVNENGELIPTTQLAHEKALRTATENTLIAQQDLVRFKERVMRTNQKRNIGIGTATPTYFPHTGSPKAVVILVEFQDSLFSVADPYATFSDYLSAEGSIPNRGLREDRNHASVKKYFTDMSDGQYIPQFDLFGPIQLDHPLAYYGAGNDNVTALVQDACNKIDNTIDFSQYDSNQDGKVDLVYIIYAGYSESVTGNSSDCIWPKSGSQNFGTWDGVSVNRYGVNNELNYYPGRKMSADPQKRINGIGLFCHEFSHTLGLPDLYSQLLLDNQEMEYWDLMDGGEYTDNGYTPTPYTPWEKEVMGWHTINTLSEAGHVALKNGESLKVEADDSNEYIILHNIQNTGWAAKLPGHGMLVYRIDYGNRTSVNLSDYPNTKAGKPGITIVPADSLLISSYRVYSDDTPTESKPYSQAEYLNSHFGDPFPGSTKTDSLLTVELNSTTLNKPIYNIYEAEDDGTITFSFVERNAPITEFDKEDNHYVVTDDEDNTVEIVTPDETPSDSLVIAATVTYAGEDYQVTAIEEGAFINYDNIETVTIEAETPPAVISSSQAKAEEAPEPRIFSDIVYENAPLYVPDGCVSTYQDAPGWKHFKTILVIGTTGIKPVVKSQEPTGYRIFSISGQLMGTDIQSLAPGFYIRNHRKFVVK